MCRNTTSPANSTQHLAAQHAGFNCLLGSEDPGDALDVLHALGSTCTYVCRCRYCAAACCCSLLLLLLQVSFKLFGLLPGAVGLRGRVIPVPEGQPHGLGTAGQRDTVRVLFEPPVLSLGDSLHFRIGGWVLLVCRAKGNQSAEGLKLSAAVHQHAVTVLTADEAVSADSCLMREHSTSFLEKLIECRDN